MRFYFFFSFDVLSYYVPLEENCGSNEIRNWLLFSFLGPSLAVTWKNSSSVIFLVDNIAVVRQQK